MRKKIIALMVSLFLISPGLVNIYPVKAQNNALGQVIFINQVRGDECCDKGSLENLKTQVNTFVETSLPAYFAIRYDALTDPSYVNYIKRNLTLYPNLIKTGILFEITPQLAQAASVIYRGDVEHWYEAQNVFSIGYAPEDRKRLTDQLFNTFYETFGFYPEIVSSWMIDTPTVNYITNTYKVRLFQITREQWGQDSYTLYGGPNHYPYPASARWVFIPDFARLEAPVIVRQTITSPLRNYGDMTSSFTSQPNDYMRDKKSFDYFRQLFEQSMHQLTLGFANLGLENSMDRIFQEEFQQQIRYVKKAVDANEVMIPSTGELIDFWQKQRFTVYQGSDIINHTDDAVYTVRTPKFRVRIRDFGKIIAITDFRLYDTNFDDPYTISPAKKKGFWIVPYIIDGSHGYLPDQNSGPWFFLKKMLGMPDVQNLSISPKPDDNWNINSVRLPEKFAKSALTNELTKDGAIIRYTGNNGQKISITIGSNKITIDHVSLDDVSYQGHNPSPHPLNYLKTKDGFNLNWMMGKDVLYSLKASCQNSQCKLMPKVTITNLAEARKEQYPFLFPEPIDRPVDMTKTVVYAHNQYAVTGRNPARIIVIPYDAYGIPLKLSEPLGVDAQPQVSIETSTNGIKQYVDIRNDKPTTVDIRLTVGGKKLKKTTVFIAPNCKTQFIYCITHPQGLWWYINSFIGDKYRQIVLGEKQG